VEYQNQQRLSHMYSPSGFIPLGSQTLTSVLEFHSRMATRIDELQRCVNILLQRVVHLEEIPKWSLSNESLSFENLLK